MAISEYQREQIRKAAEAGKYKGRKKGSYTYRLTDLLKGWCAGKLIREIAAECGVSENRIYVRLRELREAGLLPERVKKKDQRLTG